MCRMTSLQILSTYTEVTNSSCQHPYEQIALPLCSCCEVSAAYVHLYGREAQLQLVSVAITAYCEHADI